MTPGNAERSQRHESAIQRHPDATYLHVALALLALAVILAGFQLFQSFTEPPPAPLNFSEFFDDHMTMTRIVIGVTTILLSPLLLTLALAIFSIRPRCTSTRIYLVALMPPALAFSLSWLSAPLSPLAVLLAAIAGLFAFHKGLALSWAQSTGTWFLHGIALTLIAAAALYALESGQAGLALHPANEFRALRAQIQQPRNEGQEFPVSDRTASPTFQWQASGSEWMDRRANLVQVGVYSTESPDRTFDILDTSSGKTVGHGRVSKGYPQSSIFMPTPGVPYQVKMTKGFVVGDRVTIRSLQPATLPR